MIRSLRGSCLPSSPGQTLFLPVLPLKQTEFVAMFYHHKSGPSPCHRSPSWPLLLSWALLSSCSQQSVLRRVPQAYLDVCWSPYESWPLAHIGVWTRSQHFSGTLCFASPIPAFEKSGLQYAVFLHVTQSFCGQQSMSLIHRVSQCATAQCHNKAWYMSENKHCSH